VARVPTVRLWKYPHPEVDPLPSSRTVPARVLAGILTVVTSSLLVTIQAPVAGAAPQAGSHWTWCNDNTVASTPAVVWARIKGATTAKHGGIPATYWSDLVYRRDIARIACYESTWEFHAENGSQFGWFQMSPPLMTTEGVSFNQYWAGSHAEAAGWYQCTAGERYIHARYGTPVAAWSHEENYGWY
jgi:hypothetical protein